MPSQDETPRDGRPLPHPGDTDRTGEVGQIPSSAADDPLWGPTGEHRTEAGRSSMPMGTSPARNEPARTPYGQTAPPSPSRDVVPPTAVIPSTEVPRIGYDPVAGYQPQTAYDPRPAYEVPVTYEPAVVVPPPRKPVWPWVVAVLAVILGGVIGWIVSQTDDDTVTDAPPTSAVVQTTEPGDAVEGDLGQRLDAVLADTKANGVYTDSGIAQLDEIVAIDRQQTAESLQGQVDLLSVAQEQSVSKITELEDQVASLEQSVAQVTAERDQLKAASETNTGAMTDTEFLARLQEKEDRISGLEDQLATASSQLTDAQATAQKATDDLRTAQSQLQTANATLQALDAKPIVSYVNSDISRIRADASANGWVLVEQQVDSAQATPGTVTLQQPPAGETVIRGSVVYVEYDKA